MGHRQLHEAPNYGNEGAGVDDVSNLAAIEGGEDVHERAPWHLHKKVRPDS